MKEANILNKIKHDKFNEYTAKETLEYWWGKSKFSKEKESGTCGRVNDEKGKITKRHETEVVTGRGKVGKRAIKKVRTKERVPPTITCWWIRCLKKKGA